ncbi:conserved membrane hypothetical protein [Tenacibaculum sp. 190524A02b]|uniref:DUF4234 domain-containing protein n=1 Tax=Tenacibaculum vairaonense TaxID=3137860 RepID=A0ABM9PQP2_9FLAO
MYNYLIFHAYNLALKSRENRDEPVYIVMMLLIMCIGFNIYSVFFLLKGVGIINDLSFINKDNEAILGLLLLGLIAAYFLPKKRYKTIYEKIASKHVKQPSTLLSILVVVLYYVGSFLILLVTGLYMNKDWIFK